MYYSDRRIQQINDWIDHADNAIEQLNWFKYYLDLWKGQNCTDEQFMGVIRQLQQADLESWADVRFALDNLRAMVTGKA